MGRAFFFTVVLAPALLAAGLAVAEAEQFEFDHAAATERTGERTAALHYAAAWLEIPFAEAAVALAWRGEEFTARGEGWAAGPLSGLFPFRGYAATRGAWAPTGPAPREHRNGGEFWGKERSVRVWWDGRTDADGEADGMPEWEAAPAADLEKVTPVPTGALAGARDPFSAALLAGLRIGRTGECAGTEVVWDGRRLAQWELSHIETTELAADAPGAWEGPALVCELRLRKLGGFRRNSRHAPLSPPRVWVAEVLPGLWAPARAEIYSRWGKVVARLDVRKTTGSAPAGSAAGP